MERCPRQKNKLEDRKKEKRKIPEARFPNFQLSLAGRDHWESAALPASEEQVRCLDQACL